jgi:predicted exporter
VAATGIALILAYKRLAALRIMLPTVISLVVTPAITMLFGLPFSFFSVMGLFLVVGAGVDYAIFQWEHPREEGVWTRVGIVLAAAMTCISVGLLGLSSVLPVKSFGLTVAVGILLSLILSPLVRGWRSGAFSGDRL